jgi:hypothetical protein
MRIFELGLTLRALPAGRAFITNVEPTSDVSCRAAGTAHGSKPGGSSIGLFLRRLLAFERRLSFDLQRQKHRFGSSVRRSMRLLRNAYRRASPNAISKEISSRFSPSLRDEGILKIAHRFVVANLELSLQRDVRASLRLDARLGNTFAQIPILSNRLASPILANRAATQILRPALTRSFRRNVTMRAADECHPLPDQLHPCSRFFRFS